MNHILNVGDDLVFEFDKLRGKKTSREFFRELLQMKVKTNVQSAQTETKTPKTIKETKP